jgi:hypothetical protein
MAVWKLRIAWEPTLPTDMRLKRFAKEMAGLANAGLVISDISKNLPVRRLEFDEEDGIFEMDVDDAVPF